MIKVPGPWARRLNQIISIVGLLTLLLFFTACGRAGFVVTKGGGGDFSSAGICESQLKSVYQRTYFPLLSQNCNNCHSSGHGSHDLAISFSGFLAKGESLIEYKATHPHGDNGINLVSEIAAIKSEWTVGQEEYISCLSEGSGGAGRLRVDSKPVANINQTVRLYTTTGLYENTSGTNAWKSIEWDLETEVPMADRGQFQAYLKAEARLALQSGQIIGFEFRNPSMRLKAASTGNNNIEVQGMNLLLNNDLQFNVTTYTSVAKVIATTSETLLAPGTAYALAWFPGADNTTPVAFEITHIQHTSAATDPGSGGDPGNGGTQVHFADLISTDAQLGVFRNTCFSCHTGATPLAGLDLSNYDSARSRITQILSRINSTDPNLRMPRGAAPLSQQQKDVVANWANGGAPL